LVNRETGGYVNWNPEKREVPTLDFLFLTSAPKKAKGLAKMLEGNLIFGSWSPTDPPKEPNYLRLDGLIGEKAKKLTGRAVEELDKKHKLRESEIPQKFLVCDVHPSVGYPGATGVDHLTKPPDGLSYLDLQRFASKEWLKFENSPVTVQLASAYAFTNRDGKLVTCRPKKDSVFITFASNPLPDLSTVEQYLKYLHNKRFPGLSSDEFIVEASKIAGVIMNEYLVTFAEERGIDVVVSQALSNPWKPSTELIEGIGAGGLTPAIVGWIATHAAR